MYSEKEETSKKPHFCYVSHEPIMLNSDDVRHQAVNSKGIIHALIAGGDVAAARQLAQLHHQYDSCQNLTSTEEFNSARNKNETITIEPQAKADKRRSKGAEILCLDQKYIKL